MTERYKLPESGGSPDFYAEFTVIKTDDYLLVTEEWIDARGRGDEMMGLIKTKLQEIATAKNLKVVHRLEAYNIPGKKLIQRQGDYTWTGRSPDGNSMYEKEFLPENF